MNETAVKSHISPKLRNTLIHDALTHKIFLDNDIYIAENMYETLGNSMCYCME